MTFRTPVGADQLGKGHPEEGWGRDQDRLGHVKGWQGANINGGMDSLWHDPIDPLIFTPAKELVQIQVGSLQTSRQTIFTSSLHSSPTCSGLGRI